VAISKFDKQLQIEQLRYIETEHPSDMGSGGEFSGQPEHGDFAERLWQRAQYLVQQYGFSALLNRAARVSRYVKTFALFFAVLLGALAALYAVTDSQTVNIYWLLLVLLGFNVASMLIWLIGISLHIEALGSGVLARLMSWVPGHLESKAQAGENRDRENQTRENHAIDNLDSKKIGLLADRAWIACSLSGVVGKWQFSKISHQLWLAYLFSGLLFLVLLLMVRQYDFVWGTTLLSDKVFVSLTEVLSVPLDALGFATPTPEQVQQTRIGTLSADVTQLPDAELRYLWAQFLIGSLLCFGIAPRVILLAWSVMMHRRARRLFELDYYLPYYIRLRQRLMPLASHGQVIDADTAPADNYQSPALRPAAHPLPAGTRWVAVELGDDISWPPASIDVNDDLGQVVDRETLASVLQRLQDTQYPVLAVVVSSARAPDRGVQRSIASLVSGSKQRWLVLLQRHEDEPVSDKRLAAWYRLAAVCDVPADHVISLGLDQGEVYEA